MRTRLAFPAFLSFSLMAQVPQMSGLRPSFPSQDRTGDASIEGAVMDAISREPIKKASVMLNGPAHLTAVTDASGHFAFRQLPAGQFTIQAHSDKYPQSQGLLDDAQPISVSLAAADQKQDISLSLTPGASVSGHIVDEDGSPMNGCNVIAMRSGFVATNGALQQTGSSQSNEKGEYRIPNLPRGKYFVQAHCYKRIPLPHAFIRRSANIEAPALSYAPQFYPGVQQRQAALRIEPSPGTDAAGIDIRMSPASGVLIRGHVGPATDRIQLMLEAKDPLGSEVRQGARVDPATGEFQIQNVLPGAYELIATSSVDGITLFASYAVNVGAAPPDPIDLTLAPAPAITGSIALEGDTKASLNSLHVFLNPLEVRPMTGRQAQSEVQSDGTFTLNSVTPGHWRLNINGIPGYVKSVRQGDQDASPWDLEIGTAAAPLKIIVGTKFAQLEATLAAPGASTGQTPAGIWSASGDPNFVQNVSLNPQGPSTLNVPPGKYYACAFQIVQTWAWMQNRALRKALESHCETVDASEGSTVRVQVPLIPMADLKQFIDKIEE